jgi:Poly(hydroxyalcanoate) granule associated protein (phasin)
VKKGANSPIGGRQQAKKKSGGSSSTGRRGMHPDRETASPSSSSRKPGFDFTGSTLGASIGRFVDLQRKVLRVGTAAARSAVDNPASRRVKHGVTESLEGGLRKLEQVFDERVASALSRMGMPPPAALRDLCATVEMLQAERKPKSRKRK